MSFLRSLTIPERTAWYATYVALLQMPNKSEPWA